MAIPTDNCASYSACQSAQSCLRKGKCASSGQNLDLLRDAYEALRGGNPDARMNAMRDIEEHFRAIKQPLSKQQ